APPAAPPFPYTTLFRSDGGRVPRPPRRHRLVACGDDRGGRRRPRLHTRTSRRRLPQHLVLHRRRAPRPRTHRRSPAHRSRQTPRPAGTALRRSRLHPTTAPGRHRHPLAHPRPTRHLPSRSSRPRRRTAHPRHDGHRPTVPLSAAAPSAAATVMAVAERKPTIELSMAELRAVTGYAVACAEPALVLFERARPDDRRPHIAIEAARRFAEGAVPDQKAPGRRVGGATGLPAGPRSRAARGGRSRTR